MRTVLLPTLLLAAAALLARSLPAEAAPLTLVSSSSLEIQIGPEAGTLGAASFAAGVDTQIGVSSGSGTFTLPADLFQGTFAPPTQLFTGIPLFVRLTLVLDGHGSVPLQTDAAGGGNPVHFARPGGGLGGQGALDGTAILNVMSLFNLDVPLGGVGVDGSVETVSEGGMQIWVYGTGWTTGAVQILGITTQTPGTIILNTVTVAGFDQRTAGHRGTLQLVSPFKAVSGAFGNLPGVAVMTLEFVPEPGLLLLLGSGVAGLVLAGRRRLGL